MGFHVTSADVDALALHIANQTNTMNERLTTVFEAIQSVVGLDSFLHRYQELCG
jgi:hypothetical protein